MAFILGLKDKKADKMAPQSHNHVPVKGYPARVKCQVLL